MIVIFATSIPFIKQHEIDMYVSSISTVAQVRLWDLSLIYKRQDDNVTDIVSNREIVSDIFDFEEKLNESCALDKVFFVTNILVTHLNKIHKCLKKRNVPIININKEGLAAWLSYSATLKYKESKPFSAKYRFKSIIKTNSRLRILYKRIMFGQAKYDYLLSSYNFFPEDSKRFIQIHNIKYDEYISALDSINIIDEEYILFIDAALAGHPMLSRTGNALDEKAYIQSLNTYFKSLEELYKIPVIISAHPKSLYNDDTFAGRKIIKYKTPELVQHCKFIISHYSTSLINAVLLKKPIKVLTSNDLENSATRSSILMALEFADRLKLDVIDLDNPVFTDFVINESIYEDFTNKFILNINRVDKSNHQLIIEFFEELDRKI